MAKKLYVGNLPYSATGDQLKDLFSQAGEVSEASVISDRMSGRSKGFGFVQFEDDAAADKAIEMFNNYDWEGRAIVVNEARPMEPRPMRPGGSTGGSRGGFGGGAGGRGGSRGGFGGGSGRSY